MSTAPDPKTVREQARNIILDHAKDIEYPSIGEMIADLDEFSSLPEDEFDRAQGQIDKMIRNAVVAVSWPDEQQPADVVTAEQQPFVADADTPAGRIGVWLTAWKRYFGTLGLPFGADLIAGPPPSAEPRVSADDFGVVLEVLAVVLAERARSATAEQQQDGAAEDVTAFLDALPPRIDIVADWNRNGVRTELTADALRAVLAERSTLAARVAELESEREADARAVESMLRATTGTERYAAAQELYHCFADRIEALGVDTDGGAE